MALSQTVGVVGGNGQLGGAIARAWLRSGCVAPDRLWISSRSGSTAGFEAWSGISFTTRNQDLADACDTILLSVPPHLVATVGLKAEGRLVLSVMAGVSIDAMARLTGASRIVRAMSNPAADIGLAYSPWCAGAGATPDDRQTVRALFEACGETDEVPDEDQIDRFTAITGPVPGFVAFYADCMVKHAVRHGIDPAVANRAVRQLFLAGGTVLAGSADTPAEQVKVMLDYAGTTAAGLEVMQSSSLMDCIDRGLDAAYERARTIAGGG